MFNGWLIMKQREMGMKQRNSSVEALKVIAVIMIVFSHAMPNGDPVTNNFAIPLGQASTDIQYVIMVLMSNMGQVGNDIFLVCSAWFLLDSKTTRLNKIISMVGDCFVISIVMVLFFIMAGRSFSVQYIIRQFLPITFGNYWFLTCYILFYAIHPLLNIILDAIEKEKLLLIDIVFIVLYCFISFIMSGSAFCYSNLIGFIGIYFIVAYIKKYLITTSASKKFGCTIMLGGIVLWLSEIVIINIVGVHISAFSTWIQKVNNFINPCYILIAIGAFLIARKYFFYNKVINYCSKLSLLIYMIHCNNIIRDYVRFDFFEFIYYTYSYDYLLVWVIVFGLISLSASFLLAIIYKETLQKITNRFYLAAEKFLTHTYKRFEEAFLRLN